MRYELPKSYSERRVASGQPKLFFPQSKPSSAAAGNPSGTLQTAAGNPTPPQSTSVPPRQDFIPAADYQALLLELRQRDKDHERLQQVFKQLLADFSKLQTNYEQVVSKLDRSSPPPSAGDRNPTAPHPYRYAPERRPQSVRRKIADAPPAPHNSDSNLPELSFLNRLREKERNPSWRPERSANGMANTAEMATYDAVTPQTGGNPPDRTLENAAPRLSELGDERDSVYQRARQEHTNGRTPIWMWVVAWLLLLPISAGLGYTLVQWTMNSGSPSDLPAQIAPAE